jgi:hypothetical protein
MSSKAQGSGTLLTLNDMDEVAVRIAEMWSRYNTERRNALTLNEEARRYVFATDIDSTTANQLDHKNRTHQPKLTQISDTLQAQYFEASLSMPMFFRYQTPERKDRDGARNIEAWVRSKLEQRKFRETTGRQLLADYVNYGNTFATVDYVVEKNEFGEVTYKGPDIKRTSPLDVVFNPRAVSFAKSPKIERALIHLSEIAEMDEKHPNSGFKQDVIQKAIETRHPDQVDDWVEVIKNRGINMDGFGGFDQYFKQDLAEVLIYRGDVFDPETGRAERNRVVYVMDKIHVIRNEPSKSPVGYDGIHHAGWRVRNDNLWAQGPLDNLVGMQYRIDHLENLKADVFDQIARPVLFIRGDDVQEPAEGYAPGATYYGGTDSEVRPIVPDVTALNANNEIAAYHRLMEEMAGAPPETRGIRTPGEKTAFEVSKLDQNSAMMFVDRARNFERMLETLLRECFELMLINYDGSDYIQIFDDIAGEEVIREIAQEDVAARGEFVAIGARHWTRRNRETLEMQNFQEVVLKDPKIRAHVSGEALANLWAEKLNLTDEGIVEPFAGIIEDVRLQAIAQAEAAQLQEDAEGPIAVGDASGTGTEVAPGQEPATDAAQPSQGQPGPT